MLERVSCGKSVDVTIVTPDSTEIVRSLRGEDKYTKQFDWTPGGAERPE